MKKVLDLLKSARVKGSGISATEVSYTCEDEVLVNNQVLCSEDEVLGNNQFLCSEDEIVVN
ncbi:MAG: hypothetical protein QG657_3724 [Acidobacteriota bacterium]|nr:hypothetical protein [Acidobacteriota bacterium]